MKNGTAFHSTITNQQKALLHVAKTKMGLDEDTYRAILFVHGGVESSRDLNQEGFKRVISHLENLGFVNESSKMGKHKPRCFRTPNQDPCDIPYPAHLRRMDELFAELGWMEPERRQGFCRRMVKKPWPQTKYEVNRIIEGLKAMLARKPKEE